MSASVVQVKSPEEREYDRYLLSIEERKRQTAELRAELEALKLTLGRFDAEYHARVGVLFIELDRINLAIREYQERITRLQSDPYDDPSSVEADVKTQFNNERENLHNDEEEARRYEKVYQREQERPQLDAEAEAQMQRMYRELAKRFHPDLARTQDEKEQREVFMRRVNAAFQERDLDGLQAIASEGDVIDPAFESRSIGEKLVWAIREVARLEDLILSLEQELVAVRSSKSHELWQRQEGDESVIEKLVSDLTIRINDGRDHLDGLTVAYNRMVSRRPI